MYYSEDQVRNALDVCGLKVRSSTRKTFITNCPFHGNTGTPAFNVAKDGAGFNCHNPSCGAHGSLIQLIQSTTNKTYWSARRMIESREYILNTIETKVHENLSLKQDFEIFDQNILDRLEADFWNSPEAIDYMRGRQFTDHTLKKFGIGYSQKQGMVTVPMHDLKGRPLGFIARSIHDKQFKNSDGLPKSESIFNIHRARSTGAEAIIVVESSFDVMRLDQAGFPNAGGILGDGFSDKLAAQISRTFPNVIIMTDDDDPDLHRGKNPGQILGNAIEEKLSNKIVQWAHSGGNKRFPPGIKDVCDMTDEQIRQHIRGALYSWEYQSVV